MTFELVRWGWPNAVAILALAVVPIVALTPGADRHPAAASIEKIESAAICLAPAECIVAVAATAPEIFTE